MGILSFFDKSDKTKITIMETRNDYEIPLLTKESHTWSKEITSFPIESGGTASDHAQRNQNEYTVSGLVSDCPLDFFDIATGAWFKKPTMDAIGYFRELIESNDVVDIDTRFYLYGNMQCVSMTLDRDQSTGEALSFSATFKEMQFVGSGMVNIDTISKFAKDAAGKVAKKGPAAATKQVGKKAATPASPKASPAYDIAKGAYDLVKGALSL